MAEIIRIDASRKKPATAKGEKSSACSHKVVTAWTVYRTVTCSFCGLELDPFDVLVDILKGAPRPGNRDEESRFGLEAARREKTGPKGDPDQKKH